MMAGFACIAMNQHKFSRMDAGQKRTMTPAVARKVANMNAGRTPETVLPGLAVMNADKPLAKLEGAHVITDRYMAGENIKTIAKSLNVSHMAIYDYLWRTIPNEWPKLRAARAELQYDNAIDSMAENKNADGSPLDGLAIARTRETARFRYGELAALRREFSPKQEISGTVAPIFNINIVAAPQQKVEIDVTQDSAKPDYL